MNDSFWIMGPTAAVIAFIIKSKSMFPVPIEIIWTSEDKKTRRIYFLLETENALVSFQQIVEAFPALEVGVKLLHCAIEKTAKCFKVMNFEQLNKSKTTRDISKFSVFWIEHVLEYVQSISPYRASRAA